MVFDIKYCKGDICESTCDAIVNASNERGSGCKIPGHCVDSAIHAAAGQELFAACEHLNGIPTGEAKITPAFNLPCKWIIHTTGPVARKDTPLDWVTFAKCYQRCLELASSLKLKSVAFCCLSTGVFGFPKKQAAQVAVEVVQKWQAQHPTSSLELVLFVVYTYENLEIYADLL